MYTIDRPATEMLCWLSYQEVEVQYMYTLSWQHQPLHNGRGPPAGHCAVWHSKNWCKIPQIPIWLSIRGTCLNKSYPWRPHLVTHRSPTPPNTKLTTLRSCAHASPVEQVWYTEAQPWIRLVTQYLSTWHQKTWKKKNHQDAVILFFFFSFFFYRNLARKSNIPSQFWISVTKHITPRMQNTLKMFAQTL